VNLINGRAGDVIPVQDRGFCYGDGVFRTFLIRDGTPQHWTLQYAKLKADCARLNIVCPAADIFWGDLQVIAEQHNNCVVRITVTRGSGARGYAVPEQAQSVRVVSANPLPQYPVEYTTQGITAWLCDTRLAIQPMLAGIKHLNRLENVLARSEWSDPQIAEGIMCDVEGSVISGTMSNLFLVIGQALRTPDLSRCGIAGVQRERVMAVAKARGVTLEISPIDIKQVLAADEVFLVNSIIGIWQVTGFQGRHWNAGEMTAKFRQWLGDSAHD
jgi:4-amino-4-deoxychorismate lyase